MLMINGSVITGRTNNSRACLDSGGEQHIEGRNCISRWAPNWWIERAAIHTNKIFVEKVLMVPGHMATRVVFLDTVTHLVKTE